MKLSSYLSRSRHGVFYFRWPLPRKNGQPCKTFRLSLRTRCPDRAGVLARHLASCAQITRDNKALARLRQDQIRELVAAYFEAQLERYKACMDNHGLSPNALEDARCEMLDHETYLDPPTD